MAIKLDPGKIYRETVGNPGLQSAVINELLEMYEVATQSGRLRGGYKRLLEACLLAANYPADYSAADHGGDPAGFRE